MDVICYEKSDIGVSSEKPEKFRDDSFPVDFFGREQWESICEVELELPTEEAIGDVSTSEVFIIDTILDELLTEIEVLLFWMERHNRELVVYSVILNEVRDLPRNDEQMLRRLSMTESWRMTGIKRTNYMQDRGNTKQKV